MAATDHKERARRFWDRYIDLLHKQGIRPPFDRWHVVRAEQFLKAFPDRRLADHTPDSVRAYLEEVGRQAALQGWQFRQVIVATRLLFSMAEPESLRGFDWDFWLDSSKALEPGHPTIARAPAAHDAPADLTARIIERMAEHSCAQLVRSFPIPFRTWPSSFGRGACRCVPRRLTCIGCAVSCSIIPAVRRPRWARMRYWAYFSIWRWSATWRPAPRTRP